MQTAGTDTGAVRLLRGMIAQEGLLSVYKGVLPVLCGSQIIHACVYSSYQSIRRELDPTFKFVGAGSSHGSGVSIRAMLPHSDRWRGCGAFTGVILTPIELFKVRLRRRQAVSDQRTVQPGGFAGLIAQYGWRRGLFRGMHLTVLREAVCLLFCCFVLFCSVLVSSGSYLAFLCAYLSFNFFCFVDWWSTVVWRL